MYFVYHLNVKYKATAEVLSVYIGMVVWVLLYIRLARRVDAFFVRSPCDYGGVCIHYVIHR